MKRNLCLFLFALSSATIRAEFDPDAMKQKYVVGTLSHMIGISGSHVRNVDGIAGDELLIGTTATWQLLSWDVQASRFSQIGFYEHDVEWNGGGGGIRAVSFADLPGSANTGVGVLLKNGILEIFDLDGTPRSEWDTGILDAKGLHFVNLDDDAGDELLIQTCTELTAWEFGSAEPIWRIPVENCASMVVAQLDEDPQLEIVLASGYVFDTLTTEMEWRYPIGFGRAIIAGDMNGDGRQELFGCGGLQCAAFDVATHRVIWETFVPYPESIGLVAIGDADSDGIVDLFTGADGHRLRKLSSVTGEIRGEIPVSGAVNFLAFGDIDGDCTQELIWATGGATTALDGLHVGDAEAMDHLWSSVPEQSGASGIAVGDFKGAGSPSILWGKGAGSIIRLQSFSPPAFETRSIYNLGNPYNQYLQVVCAAQLDTDPALEYVTRVDGKIGPTGKIGVFDGATHELEWSLHLESGDTVTSVSAADLNGDGIPEILVGLSILYFPKRHPASVVAVDGANRNVMWRTEGELSTVLREDCAGCIVQASGYDLDSDGAKEVVALVPSDWLYAIDGKNGQILWHRPELMGAWSFAVGDIDPSPGSEIIIPIYGEGTVAVYDSTASTLIRDVDISEFGSGISVKLGDLDGDGQPEIVVVADGGVLVLSSDELNILWSGGSILPWLSLGNQLEIADVDGDGTVEIVVPSAHSLRVFEYRPETGDTLPPDFDGEDVQIRALESCCGFQLKWASALDESSMPVMYRIYRSGSTRPIANRHSLIAETKIEQFIDRSVSGEVTYQYAVTAVDSVGNETRPEWTIVTSPATCPRPRQRTVRRP